jgi:branched-chain amino acid transport system permease protein
MQALGYATYRYKLASFTISGAFAGLAGYLAAYQAEYVNPKLLGWQESGLGLVMVILGGAGTLHGGVWGAAAIVLLQEVFSELTAHWMLLLGLFIVAAVIWLPNGIVGFRPRNTRVTPS